MGMQETYRKAYEDRLEAQVKEWEAKLAALKTRAGQADAAAGIEFRRQVEALEAKYGAAQAKVQDLKAAGEDAWEALRAGAEKAWSDLKEAAEQAAAKFK
jgi:hypothetical protein